MEKPPSPEKRIQKEEVIAAFKKFVEQGFTDPAELDSKVPEVKEAEELFSNWQKQEDTEAGDDKELRHRANHEKTMLFIEAGFHDPEYLKDVLGWLVQDAQNAEKQKDNPRREETRLKIAEAMKKIRGLLNKTEA